MLRKADSRKSSGVSGPFDVESDAILKDYVGVAEFLVQSLWEDGTARVPGSLTVFYDDGRLKACLNDKDGSRVAFVTGVSLDDLLAACNEAILTDEGDWRPARQAAGRGRAK